MAADNAERIRFELDIDGAQAREAARALDRDMKKAMQSAVRMNKRAGDTIQDLADEAKKFGVTYSKSLKLSSEQMSTLNSRMKQLPVLIKKATQEINEHKKKTLELKKAHEGLSDGDKQMKAQELKGLEEVQKGLEKQLRTLEEIEKLQKSANFEKVFEEVSDSFGQDLRKRVEENFRGFVGTDGKATAESLKGSFAEAAASLSSKNFVGLAKGLGGIFGSMGKGIGAAVTRKGMANASAGVGGPMAGIAKTMGPLIGTLTKLGPVLGMVAGAVAAVFKVMMDAESAAKEFHKELLSTASTSEFLARSGGNVVQAYDSLNSAISSIRDAAFDYKNNLDMGITAKTHTEFLNVLTQEGVSLRRIKDDAAEAGKQAGAFSTQMVNLGVAYSRAFGVSLNDIAALQGEMMTDMGSNFEGVQKQFAAMQLGAAESGIAANKFFGIIRNVTSELSLYNMRMEDAVKIVTLLGRAMSPRNASKFLQTMTQGFKGMDAQSKLRMTLLAGQGNTKGIVGRDIDRKSSDLAKKIQEAGGSMNPEALAKAIASGSGNMKEMLAGVTGKDQEGTLKEAIREIGMQSKASKKGLFGLSAATGQLGAGGTYEMSKAALARFGGGKKSLYEMQGELGPTMMAQQLGISEEQLRQMIHFEGALEEQKDALKQNLKSPDEKKRTAALDKLKKLGIKDLKEGQEDAAIDQLQADQIMDTMDEGDKKLLEQASRTVDWAKEQANLTQSLSDKLEVIMQFLLNQLYTLFSGIYDTIVDFAAKYGISGFKEKQQRRDMLRANAGDSAMAGAIGKGGDLRNDMAAVFAANVGKAFGSSAAKFQKGVDLAKGTGPTQESQRLMDESIAEQREMAKDLIRKSNVTGAQLKTAADYAGADISHTGLMKDSGTGLKYPIEKITEEKLDEFVKSMNPEKLRDVMGKLGNVVDPATITALTSSTAYIKGKGGAAPGAPAAGPPPATKDKPPTAEQTAQTNDHLKDIAKGQEQIKIDQSNLKGPFKAAVEGGTLEAIRQGLYEYWMYSKLDPAMAATMGIGAKDMANRVNTAIANKEPLALKKNAAGGVVQPAAGEVIASVAPGETILPKGASVGGATNVSITVNGIGGQDLANFLKNKINEGIHEYKRREKFH